MGAREVETLHAFLAPARGKDRLKGQKGVTLKRIKIFIYGQVLNQLIYPLNGTSTSSVPDG
jgi:hypothetical protein